MKQNWNTHLSSTGGGAAGVFPGRSGSHCNTYTPRGRSYPYTAAHTENPHTRLHLCTPQHTHTVRTVYLFVSIYSTISNMISPLVVMESTAPWFYLKGKGKHKIIWKSEENERAGFYLLSGTHWPMTNLKPLQHFLLRERDRERRDEHLASAL